MLEIVIILLGMFTSRDGVCLKESDLVYLPALKYHEVVHVSAGDFVRYHEFLHRDAKEEFKKAGNALAPSLLEYLDFWNRAETLDEEFLFIYSLKTPIKDKQFEEAFGENLSKTGMKISKHSIYDLVYQYPVRGDGVWPTLKRREIKGILYNQSIFICAPSRKLIKKVVDTIEGREIKFLEDDMYGEILMNLEKIPRSARISINTHELQMREEKKYRAEIKKYGGADVSMMDFFSAYSLVATDDYVESQTIRFYGNEKAARRELEDYQKNKSKYDLQELQLIKSAKTKAEKINIDFRQEALKGISRTVEGNIYTFSRKTNRKTEKLRQELLAAREELKKEKQSGKKGEK